MNSNNVTFKKSDQYPCKLAVFRDYSCVLDSGYKLNNFQVAFQTYGQLNEQKMNAILIFHALTADQFISEKQNLPRKLVYNYCLKLKK